MWPVACDGRPGSVEPGRDVEVVGIGALIAFACSSFLAVASMLVQYLFFQHPKFEQQHVFLLRNDAVTAAAAPPNPVDVIVLRGIRRTLSVVGVRFGWLRRPRGEVSLRDAFEQFVLSVADVQLGMGFAVFAYGCASLFHGLSAYDWWVIVGLMWFSIITNLAAQSCLRDYFTRNPSKRPWRLSLLCALIAAVTTSMMPITRVKKTLAGQPNNGTAREGILAMPALCYMYLPSIPPSEPDSSIITTTDSSTRAAICLAILALALTIVFGALRLYERRPDGLLMKWYRNYTGEIRESAVNGNRITSCVCSEQRYRLLVVRPFLASWLVFRLYADWVGSMAAETFCVSGLTAWMTMRFVEVLKLVPAAVPAVPAVGDASQWSLAQILLLVLFATPLKAFADYACARIVAATKRRRAAGQTPPPPALRPLSRPSGLWTRAPGWWRRLRRKDVEAGDEDDVLYDEEAAAPSVRGVAASVRGAVAESEAGTSQPPSVLEHRTLSLGEPSGEDTDVAVGVRKNAYSGPERHFYFTTNWASLAVPITVLSTLVYLVLLVAMPQVLTATQPVDILLQTLVWLLVYTPLITFLFLLGCMAARERIRPKRRARVAYRALSAMVTLLCVGALVDSVFGLGGVPMSYMGLGAAGVLALVYLLFAVVAHPCRAAKGKDRSYPEDGDLEEGAALLGGETVAARAARAKFPVRKKKTFPAPSRRLSQLRGAGAGPGVNYGTMTGPRQDE